MKNGIVIPCYNEADRLKFDLFYDFIRSHKDYVLCFVNDGSADGTLAQLHSFQKRAGGRVHVYNMKANAGKAEAVRQGMRYLLRKVDVRSVGFIDADLATGFRDYKRLVKRLEVTGKNMVFGSRKIVDAQDIQRSAFREMASNVVGLLVRFIIGMPVKDTQCGAKVFSRTTADYLFSQPFMSRWLFDVELFVRMKKLFGSIVMERVEEVALMAWEEVDGSKITLKDSMRFPLQLLEIGYEYKVKPQIDSAFRVVGFGALNRAA